MITINNLHKSFGKLSVLKGIDIHAEKGKIVSVLGPNGSGKTTLIKCILGLVVPDRGDIFINGQNTRQNYLYRNEIGYLPQIAHFPENLNITELLNMIRDLRKSDQNAEELINLFDIKEFLKKPLRSLSGGTRQKVNVILSLMFNPLLFIFDEPTVGLDPISRVRFKSRVKKEKENGKTALLVTHLLSEVEELADEIIFLMDGNIYYKGSPAELKDTQQENTLEKAIAKMLENVK